MADPLAFYLLPILVMVIVGPVGAIANKLKGLLAMNDGHFYFQEHEALPTWKIRLLHWLAKRIGVSIHIEGVPWGKPGPYIGAQRG